MSGLLLSKRYWMTKVWKSETFWWDFLTCHLEQIALRGLNSPAYFWLLSFLFINNDTNERIASKWDIFFLKFFAAFSETRANRSTNFLEWQKSESLKEFWWDFLTRLLEQTALRGLNSPASFWLLSFSFVNIDNKWADCSYLTDIEWQKSEKFDEISWLASLNKSF